MNCVRYPESVSNLRRDLYKQRGMLYCRRAQGLLKPWSPNGWLPGLAFCCKSETEIVVFD
jgi:hypothetical protein